MSSTMVAPSHPKDRYRTIACRECRRCKTKCNRNWPCQACIKRGCEDICPDGVILKPPRDKIPETSGMTDLREENQKLMARIRELEKAVSLSPASSLDGESYRSSSDQKDRQTSEEELVSAYGTLSIGNIGQSKLHNQAASAEYLLEDDLDCERFTHNGISLGGILLPSHVLHLAEVFPHGRSMPSRLEDKLALRDTILSFLPPSDKALLLIERYYKHIAWMYDPIPRQQFMDRIYDRIYYSNRYGDVSDVTFDHVAVLFIILALSVAMDLEKPFDYKDSEPYYLLALAAFVLETSLAAPTLPAIQALQLVHVYTCLTERTNAEERWLLVGITMRMAQSAGLHRDFSTWLKGDVAEIERRRKLFWELFVYDIWTSFVMGRPALLANTKQLGTKYPAEYGPIETSGEAEPSFHMWKYNYGKECLVPLLDEVLGAEPPTYETILRLDVTIRRFAVPPSLQLPALDNSVANINVHDTNVSLEMQKYLALWLKESTLLYLHRSYYTHAVSVCPDNPLQSKYAASVLAAYRSASVIVRRMTQLTSEQLLTARIWTFWSSVFSAAIVLGALVLRSPNCQLSVAALGDLDAACKMIERGMESPRSTNAWRVLRNLQRRAHEAHTKHTLGSGDQAITPEEQDDELTIFGGQTRLVIAPELAQADNPPVALDSEALDFSQNSLSNAHPELWDDISAFTSYEDLPMFMPNGGHDPAFQSPDGIVPELTDLGFGIEDMATVVAPSSLEHVAFGLSNDHQNLGTWQCLVSELGMDGMQL